MMAQEITGRHVLIGFVAAFALIIGVNLVLAFAAVRTFPGLEVDNSYVASQEFDKRKAAQERLGWNVSANYADDLIVVRITDSSGLPVEAARIEATVGRATHIQEDQTPALKFDGQAYVAPLSLGTGNWNVRVKAWDRDGTLFAQRIVLYKD